MPPTSERTRIRTVQRHQLIEMRQGNGHQFRGEPLGSLILKESLCLPGCDRPLVGTRRQDSIQPVGQCDNLRRKRNLLPHQPQRIAPPIPSLVMKPDRFQDEFVDVQIRPREKRETEGRMLLDESVLARCQATWKLQDLVRHQEFTNIMQFAREPPEMRRQIPTPHMIGQFFSQKANPTTMTTPPLRRHADKGLQGQVMQVTRTLG